MKVADMSKDELEKEMKKRIKVRAIGEDDVYVGYYNHLRRRGGDVFTLFPIIRDRVNKDTKKKEQILITCEQQLSAKWMERVNLNAPESEPVHFNQKGRGRKRLSLPGMTHMIGTEDQDSAGSHPQETQTKSGRKHKKESEENEESVI